MTAVKKKKKIKLKEARTDFYLSQLKFLLIRTQVPTSSFRRNSKCNFAVKSSLYRRKQIYFNPLCEFILIYQAAKWDSHMTHLCIAYRMCSVTICFP